jgi:Uma2 family endonuclease
MDAAAYFAWEALQAERHDFYFGEVFAMAGASDAHNTVSLNIAAAIKSHLRGSPCRVFMADMRVELLKDKNYSYPDVFVTCDPRDATSESAYLKRHPKLVVEVLSPSTAEYDLGRKFEHYRAIDGLAEILFIDPIRWAIDLYRRTKDPAQWLLTSTPNVYLESIDLSLTAEAMFEGTTRGY